MVVHVKKNIRLYLPFFDANLLFLYFYTMA